jgi:hypothetical protein
VRLSLASAFIATAIGLIGCQDGLPPAPGDAAKLVVVSGNEQSGQAGTQLPQALVVRVEDNAGRAVSGHSVTFVVIAGGGSLFTGSGISDESGLVRDRWTLGTLAGTNTVEARALDKDGDEIPPTTFVATATPGGAHSILVASGAGQSAPPQSQLPEPLAARVVDQFGNGIPDATVQWSVTGGSIPSTTTTSSSGVAFAQVTTGTVAGSFSSTATHGSLQAQFSFTVVPGAPGSIVIQAGNGQTAEVGTMVPAVPTVRVLDNFGNPLASVDVHFGVITGGGTVGGAVANAAWTTTNDDGIAWMSWQLGAAPGSNSLRAAIAGLDPATFTATAVVGPPYSITVVAGDLQVAPPGTLVPIIPDVVVRDRMGNGLAGSAVTFAVPTGDGIVTGGSTVTGSDGHARPTSWNLGTEAGYDTLTVTVGTLSPVSIRAFALSESPDVQIFTRCRECGPVTDETANDSLHVSISISSTFAIAEARARVEDRRAVLVERDVGIFGKRWSAYVDLRGLPTGSLSAVISARDVNGNARDIIIVFRHTGN